MAVITVADYKLLVSDYQAALAQVAGVATHYFNAAYKVLLLNVFDPEIDLLVAFHNAYLVADNSFAAQPQSVVNAVKTLQQHLLAKAVDVLPAPLPGADPIKFTSVDAFYADHSADFPTGGGNEFFTPAFAALSQQAGFTIGASFVQ